MTTFSTFTRETPQLFRTGKWPAALLNLGTGSTFGLPLVFSGASGARRPRLAA